MALSNLLGWESANRRSAAAAKHKLVPHLSNNTIDGRILHQLGYIKPCKLWDKLPDHLSTGAGFLPSTVPQLNDTAGHTHTTGSEACWLVQSKGQLPQCWYIVLTKQLYRDCCVLLWKQYGHPVDSSQKNPKTTQWNICWEYHCHLPTFPTLPAIHIQQPKVQLCHGFRLKRHGLRIHQPSFLCVFYLGSPSIHRQIVEGFPLPKTKLPRSRYLLTSTWSPNHERENIRRSMYLLPLPKKMSGQGLLAWGTTNFCVKHLFGHSSGLPTVAVNGLRSGRHNTGDIMSAGWMWYCQYASLITA